jgi:hypothetical protein
MKGLPTFDNFSFSLNRKRISSALLAPIQREGGVRPTEKARREAGRGCRLPSRNLLAAIARTQGAASLQPAPLRSRAGDRSSELPD